MSTLTTRERLEKAKTDTEAFVEQIDAKGPMTSEDIAELNRRVAEIGELKAAHLAAASAEGTLNDAKAYLSTLAGVPADAKEFEPRLKVGDNGLIQPTNGMTFGEAFVKSPAYQDFVAKNRKSDGSIREGRNVESTSFTVGGFNGLDGKALVTGVSSTSAGAFVQNAQLPGVTDLIGERELTVRQLCTNINIESDTFEFVQITAKTNNAAAVAEAANTNPPAISGASPGPYTQTLDAAGGYKPESALTLAVVTSPVETIAHFIPVTRRAAADAGQIRGLIDAFLLDGLREEEEDQILNGNGTSPNLRGILNTVGINTVGSAGTDIDAIVDAIRVTRVTGRRNPTAVVMHPNDWFSTGFLLAKDTAGNYLIGDPRASVDQLNQLWGLRVVVSEAMTENTALVGDFRQAIVADRQQSTIYVTDSHADWFVRNILAVLAEERLGFGVRDPQAFTTVTAI